MSATVDEYILAAICVAPFVLVGAGAVWLLLFGNLCEEAGE